MNKGKHLWFTTIFTGLLLALGMAAPGCQRGKQKDKANLVSRIPEPKKVGIPVQQVSLNSDFFEGRKVFESKNCNQCHGIFEDTKKSGPHLDSSIFKGSFLDIFSILWNHAPAMEVHRRKAGLQPPQFSSSELNQLISFLYLLPYIEQAGDPKRGEALLQEKNCFTCHSLNGRGKASGIPLDKLATSEQSQVGLIQRMWNHGPLMMDQMKSTGTPIPRVYGTDFSDLFLALKKSKTNTARLSFGVGNADNGEKAFKAKGCINCHSIHGQGGHEAPDFGNSNTQSNITTLSTQFWNHAVGMQAKFKDKKMAWPVFSENEMNDLILFLYSINFEDKTGDPVNGEHLFISNKCAECHFKSQLTKEKLLGDTRSINSARFAALLWNHVPSMEASMVSKGVTWPHLSGKDLRDLQAYLRNQ